MSIDMMNRVWWRDDLQTMEKFVALALADASNDEGVSWPAVATIARKCSCSPRTVQNAINGLVGKQLLRKRFRQDRSSYYVFNIGNLPLVERPRRLKEIGPHEDNYQGAMPPPDLFNTGAGGAGGTGAADSATGADDDKTGESGSKRGAGDSPRTIIEPSEEPSSSVMTDAEIASAYVERWNALAANVDRLERINRLGDKRKTSLLARVGEYEPGRDRERVLALLDRVIGTVEGSRFLRGEVKDFFAKPDWCLTPTYFPKLEERQYEQDARPDYVEPAGARGSSHVAAGQAARDVLQSRGGTARRSARELAGLPSKRAADAR